MPAGETRDVVAGMVVPLRSAAKFGIDTSRVLGVSVSANVTLLPFTRPGMTPVITTITPVSMFLTVTILTTSEATLPSIEQVGVLPEN